jgi:hypothetical protein
VPQLTSKNLQPCRPKDHARNAVAQRQPSLRGSEWHVAVVLATALCHETTRSRSAPRVNSGYMSGDDKTYLMIGNWIVTLWESGRGATT